MNEAQIERKVIVGMIHNDRFIREVSSIYNANSLTLNYTKIIAKWCLEYYENYKESPKAHINDIFNISKNALNDDDIEIIEHFLGSLEDEVENIANFNVGFVLDKAEVYFRKQNLVQIRDKLKTAIIGDRIEEAENLVSGFVRTARPESTGVNPFEDEDVIRNAFTATDDEGLFKLPGDLGEQVGGFNRGDLVAVVAPTKVGKSWFLQELALTAIYKGLNVLFISFEMNEEEMTQRIYQNVFASPLNGGDVLIPIFDCEKNQLNTCRSRARTCNVGLYEEGDEKPNFYDDSVSPEYEICNKCRGTNRFKVATWFTKSRKHPLTFERAKRKGKKIMRNILRDKKFKLIQFPSGSVTMTDLRTHILNWQYYDDFFPDVIITDYADKIASSIRSDQKRIQIGDVWDKHKSLAQELNVVVCTASQANTVRTGAKVGQGNWSEDISKPTHVNVGFSVNQNIDNKRDGIFVINVLYKRNKSFDQEKDIIVTENRDIGKPLLDSYYER